MALETSDDSETGVSDRRSVVLPDGIVDLGDGKYQMTVRLRRAVDGVERDCIDEVFADEEFPGPGVLDVGNPQFSSTHYSWSDGYDACDCNRAVLFARAAGDQLVDAPCGDGGFVVVAPDWLGR